MSDWSSDVCSSDLPSGNSVVAIVHISSPVCWRPRVGALDRFGDPLLGHARRRKGMQGGDHPISAVAPKGQPRYAPPRIPEKGRSGQLFVFGAATGRPDEGGGAQRTNAGWGKQG